MTINDTLKQIEGFGQQLDAQVGRLSEVAHPSLQALDQIGGQPDARSVLTAMFAGQLVGAMARLKAVYRDNTTPAASVAQRKAGSPIIDVTDYKEVPGGS